MDDKLSYQKSGVDIDVADATKQAMARSLETRDPRVLNKLGAFASLFDARFPDLEHPVLVLKIEEPGSKQKLAFQHKRPAGIAYDLINHLVNDIIVMGARPLAVLDVIICGKIEKEVVSQFVDALAKACREQDCSLVGGETSEQPGVVEAGVYVLAASIVGVADRDKVIDGSKIAVGDTVLAVASNGLHTNGYSLVRALIARKPDILAKQVAGESFLDAILRPHKCYWQPFRGLFAWPELHGLAHITGSGIAGNLNRILPPGLDASIDLSAIRILPIFKAIRDAGGVDDPDMLRTFNLGVGMTLVVAPSAVSRMQSHLAAKGCESYPIGEIVKGKQQVAYHGALRWPAKGAVPMSARRIYGIDFSGALDAGRKIWITGATGDEGVLRVEQVLRGDELPGSASSRPACLTALRDFIGTQKDAVLGLDFPFSLPFRVLPSGSWEEFVLSFGGRYGDESHFRESCRRAGQGAELRRVTDTEAGTPFSAYNLRLYRQTYFGIHDVLCPLVRDKAACVLPFHEPKPGTPWLLEICPASTLKRLKLYAPYKGKGPALQEGRERIVEALEAKGLLAFAMPELRDRLVRNTGGDALDSALAAVATFRAVSDPEFPDGAGHGAYLLEGYVYA
ncbi:MAG TPA: phosphoribosylformylglycinamidine cyclo-ligase [Planctomycetota bacterium]|nr:phosphoribosylformylglycinamidine cyclo-ligase [Planctomycetota bacterium]